MPERGIGVVGHLRRAPQDRDLGRQLVHHQRVEERRAVFEREAAAPVREPARHETTWRRGEAMIGDAIKPRADGAGDIGGKMDFCARHLGLGALGFGCAVEKELGRAVGRYDRDAVAFEDAEIGGIAQIVALPGIAVEHHLGDAGLSHRRRADVGASHRPA